jgi:hypothetical protein
MEPREVLAFVDGEARRFSRLAELVAWGVWLVVVNMPFTKTADGHSFFRDWFRDHTPPGFIPPKETP